MKRCAWVPEADPEYVAYHDDEWGVPSRDERHLFEMLTLEGAQAGLSWSTILRKREGYRKAFANFDAAKVARFSDTKVERLLADPGIVRNRLKVESTVNNAQPRARARQPQRLHLELRRRRAEGEPLPQARRAPGRDRRVEGDEQGPEEARLPLRRPDGLLRVHAGVRPRQRPHGRLLPLPRGAD